MKYYVDLRPKPYQREAKKQEEEKEESYLKSILIFGGVIALIYGLCVVANLIMNI